MSNIADALRGYLETLLAPLDGARVEYISADELLMYSQRSYAPESAPGSVLSRTKTVTYVRPTLTEDDRRVFAKELASRVSAYNASLLCWVDALKVELHSDVDEHRKPVTGYTVTYTVLGRCPSVIAFPSAAARHRVPASHYIGTQPNNAFQLLDGPYMTDRVLAQAGRLSEILTQYIEGFGRWQDHPDRSIAYVDARQGLRTHLRMKDVRAFLTELLDRDMLEREPWES